MFYFCLSASSLGQCGSVWVYILLFSGTTCLWGMLWTSYAMITTSRLDWMYSHYDRLYTCVFTMLLTHKKQRFYVPQRLYSNAIMDLPPAYDWQRTFCLCKLLTLGVLLLCVDANKVACTRVHSASYLYTQEWRLELWWDCCFDPCCYVSVAHPHGRQCH